MPAILRAAPCRRLRPRLAHRHARGGRGLRHTFGLVAEEVPSRSTFRSAARPFATMRAAAPCPRVTEFPSSAKTADSKLASTFTHEDFRPH